MSNGRTTLAWSMFAAGAVVGCFASMLLEPHTLSAGRENPRGVVHGLADVESQVAGLQDQVRELQALLAGMERTGDGDFVFQDPVVVNPREASPALHVFGDAVIESGTLPATEATLRVAGKTVFNNGHQLDEPTVEVVGHLDGNVVDCDLLLGSFVECSRVECVELLAEETVSGFIVECDILNCSDTGFFPGTLSVERGGTLSVRGRLKANGAEEVLLPPHEH